MSRATASVLCEVAAERERQDARWGEQNYPDGTGGHITPGSGAKASVTRRDRVATAKYARLDCDYAATMGHVTFRHILAEEVAEAFAEDEPAKLRAELVQIAAVAVEWIEAIDRRRSPQDPDLPRGDAAPKEDAARADATTHRGSAGAARDGGGVAAATMTAGLDVAGPEHLTRTHERSPSPVAGNGGSAGAAAAAPGEADLSGDRTGAYGGVGRDGPGEAPPASPGAANLPISPVEESP